MSPRLIAAIRRVSFAGTQYSYVQDVVRSTLSQLDDLRKAEDRVEGELADALAELDAARTEVLHVFVGGGA